MVKVYLVGGAVRDQLLGRTVHERDWVVVGATAQHMLEQGYQQVGKDFPVFLHPQTKEEYALARTERKVEAGYHGFNVHAEPSVTLEQDLQRRDLTINAIAQDDQGQLVDPYHGQADIKQRILRHVSPAFVEDPVRILRVARFAARFPEFSIADETLALMREMVVSGEMQSAVAERVWRELQRALCEPAAWRFFMVLQQVGALEVVMPQWQLDAIDEATMQRICQLSASSEIRWASCLFFQTLASVKAIQRGLRVPKAYADLALSLVQHATDLSKARSLSAADLLKLLLACDVVRREQRFQKLLQALQVAQQASEQVASQHIDANLDFLQQAAQLLQQLSVADLLAQGLQGQAMADAVQCKRLDVLQTIVSH